MGMNELTVSIGIRQDLISEKLNISPERVKFQ